MSPLWISFFMVIVAESESKLEAYGCDEGWVSLRDHCYTIVPMEGNSTRAQSMCNDLGAQTASIWSTEEMEFLLSIWQKESDFLWLGLSVNPQGEWQWEDGSKLQISSEDDWSVLNDAGSELALPVTGECGALTPSGGLTVLECSRNGTGVACKQALTKVYVWTGAPTPGSPVVSGALTSMFERLLPPALSTLPSSTHTVLAENPVTTDTHCAFACYREASCNAFELSCRAVDQCNSYNCVLLSAFSG